ncbi:MAG: MlaD family protein [Rubrivivax sp.]
MSPAAGRARPGAIVLAVAFGLVLVGASAWRQGWFTPTGHLFVDLPTAGGVQVGTDVKLKGFKIGEVDRMSMSSNLEVQVRLRIDQERLDLLPVGTRAKVARDSPLAARHIELLVERPGGQRLASQAKVPLATGAEIDDVMASVKLTVDRLAVIAEKVAPVIDDVRQLTAEAAGQKDTLRQSVLVSVKQLEASTAGLQTMTQRLADLVGKADGDRERVVTQLTGVLERANASVASTTRLLSEAEARVPGTLQDLQALIASSRLASADLQKLLQELRRDLPDTVQKGRSMAADAQEITQGLKETWPLSSVTGRSPPGGADFDSHGGARP